MSIARNLANLIGNIEAGGGTANKNVIINGNMSVAQRGTSFTTVTDGTYTLDRFNYRKSNDGEVTITQDSSAPDGFANSLKVDVTTADASLSASQLAFLEYNVEAQDLQRLAFGTSSAKNFTLSFYVKSNKTGTYAVNISQNDNSSKQATLNYTINSANTWERKSLTFTGDTSGVINDDNGIGFLVYWVLAVGSTFTSGGSTSATFQTYANANLGAGQAVNLLDDTANEWFITGVQLEVGQNETSFEHEPFERTLAKCQRYYEILGAVASTNSMAGTVTVGQDIAGRKTIGPYFYKTEKRAAPTIANLSIGIDAGDTTHSFVFSTGTRSTSGSSTTSTDIGEADGLEGDFNILVDAEM